MRSTGYSNAFVFRTVPSAEQILVPETLLKKRKAQDKAKEETAAAAAEKKQVSRKLRSPSVALFFLFR